MVGDGGRRWEVAGSGVVVVVAHLIREHGVGGVLPVHSGGGGVGRGE